VYCKNEHCILYTRINHILHRSTILDWYQH